MKEFFCLLFTFILSVKSQQNSVSVIFDLPSYYNDGYSGSLKRGEETVKVQHDIRAFVKPYGKICGFHVNKQPGFKFPFSVDLVNPEEGQGIIRILPDAVIDYSKESVISFNIQAYDCNDQPTYSKNVPVKVIINSQKELKFTEDAYEFSALAYTPVGRVWGKLTVTDESGLEFFRPDVNCGYSILAGSMVPFTLDSLGVLRSGKVLTKESPKTYSFHAQYIDCKSGEKKRRAQTSVNVKVIQNHCEARWEGLQSTMKHSSNFETPERVLWPPNFNLNTCGKTCTNPSIRLNLRLGSTQPMTPISTANTAFCRHDLHSLERQRSICGVNKATLIDILPDPRVNIAEQVTRNPLGSLPEAIAPTFALRFQSEKKTAWRIDEQKLLTVLESDQRDRLDMNTYPLPGLTYSNIFERDFTISFWFQRKNHDKVGKIQNSDYEAVICSQENSESIARALSVAFKNCFIVVQMSTRDPSSNDPIKKAFRSLVFPQLPETVCQANNNADEQWHHYAISLSLEETTGELIGSSLMVDGELIGSLEQLNESIAYNRPTLNYFSQFITIGSCFDASTKEAVMSLNGNLADFSLLLGQLEDKSVSRCVAQCGESLLLPKASELLVDGGEVVLNSDSIDIKADNVAQAINLLSSITYVQPRSQTTQIDFSPEISSDRILHLKTEYMCGNQQLFNVSTARIELHVQTPKTNFENKNRFAEPMDRADTSNWVPKNEMSEIGQNHEKHLNNPIPLMVVGLNEIVATIPTSDPGLPLFRELQFAVENYPGDQRSAIKEAAFVTLDECLIIPINGGQMDIDKGERLNWPVGRVNALNMTYKSDEHGVRLIGGQPASQYASLLHAFRYWPPIEIDKQNNNQISHSNIIASIKFELICSYEYKSENTKPFIVKIVLQLPNNQEDKGQIGLKPGEKLFNNENTYEGDTDEDGTYSDDNYQQDEGIAPNEHEVVNYGHSNKDVRPIEDRNLVEVHNQNSENDYNPVGLAITLTLCVICVFILAVAFVMKNTNVGRKFKPFQKYRKGSRPGGRLSLRPDDNLNLTENPLEQLEAGKITLQLVGDSKVKFPPTGDTEPISRTRPESDDQFDAETRSFDGLFEDEGRIEEVDDFESESESRPITLNYQLNGEVDNCADENESDAENFANEFVSYGVRPSHLDFVTLPSLKKPLRGETNV